MRSANMNACNWLWRWNMMSDEHSTHIESVRMCVFQQLDEN